MIDGWLKLTAPAQIAVLFKELRLTLHSILKEMIRKPEVCLLACVYCVLMENGFSFPCVCLFGLRTSTLPLTRSSIP